MNIKIMPDKTQMGKAAAAAGAEHIRQAHRRARRRQYHCRHRRVAIRDAGRARGGAQYQLEPRHRLSSG